MDFLTTTELAELWNITPRRVCMMCAEGKIEGAILKGYTWLIPKDAKRPVDHRYKKRQKTTATKSSD